MAGKKQEWLKKYVIKDHELELRFESKKEADKFYKNNSCDYMDPPEVRWIHNDENSLYSWFDLAIHPYLEDTHGDYII